MTFSSQIISLIKRIPRGKVASYGQIAALAGNPRGARAVIWLLHSSSSKEKLPWHRVINSQGTISLQPGQRYEEQRAMLESEGVKRIEAKGMAFDPNFHEAISHEPSGDVASGHVIAIVQNGYMLGERVVRPALVRVAQ